MYVSGGGLGVGGVTLMIGVKVVNGSSVDRDVTPVLTVIVHAT